MKYLVLLGLSILLAACRDVPRPDYVLELTTDTKKQQVELWTRPDTSSPGYHYAFAFELPQAAYAFRQNHAERRQAVIGLLLDKGTLRPLTWTIASERGAIQDRALRKAWTEDYQDRALFVRIRGLPDQRPLGRPSPYEPMLRPRGVKGGFQLYENPAAATVATTGDQPALWGWSVFNPVIRLDCPARSAKCGLSTAYREAELHFTVPRDQVAQAKQLREGLVKFLDRSLVSSD